MLEIGDPFFARHGGKAVFLGRWITGLRVWTSWLAGASEMTWPTFVVWNALGGICWSTSVALAAYYGGTGVEKVFSKIGLYGVIVRRRRRGARRRLVVAAPAPAPRAQG